MRATAVILLGFIAACGYFCENASAQYVPKPYKLPKKHQKTPTESKAALRIGMPPLMPSNATRSGYCCLEIDINEKGLPTDIETSYCTEEKFAQPSINAAQNWKFATAVIAGNRISWENDINLVTYMLSDEAGNFIPDPEGRLSPDPRKFPNDIRKLCTSPIIS